MKKCTVILLFILSLTLTSQSKAQSEEVEQLLLNVEKLAQLRQMLSDLKKGYEVLSKGYTTIKNISEGNFHLHEAFLDGLLQVSPLVRNYRKVAGIISYQIQLVQEYKAAFRRFKESSQFTSQEMDYLSQVYSRLLEESVKNLDALATILTSGVLRMSDGERLSAIDTIYADMQDKLAFLRHFNNQTSILALQRARQTQEIQNTKKLYGINN
jgi:hypothetical protein